MNFGLYIDGIFPSIFQKVFQENLSAIDTADVQNAFSIFLNEFMYIRFYILFYQHYLGYIDSDNSILPWPLKVNNYIFELNHSR